MNTENTIECIKRNPVTLGSIQSKIRDILKHHNLTKVGDGVVEADLLYAVIEGVVNSLDLPKRKKYQHGRDFFQGEGQELANAEVDGWNDCMSAIQKQFREKLSVNIVI